MTAPGTRSPGDRFDRYVVELLLGCGGMGEVWRAIDTKLDRRVALKILPRADTLDPRWAQARARMLREAKSAAALNHPNVVSVFDVGEAEETPYIAMELVEGVTLREYIGDQSVPVRRRAQWTIEIARALAAAHQRGIVHRDVKPENVMVRHDGTLKVLDFGIARRVRVDPSGLDARSASMLTQDGELMGTLRYMAPEQFKGYLVDARVDQFAWGLVAIELLVGEHPWGARASTIATLEGILHGVPPEIPPSDGLPAALPATVARATAKSPADRFASMDALLDALEGAERMPSLPRGGTPGLATATTEVQSEATPGSPLGTTRGDLAQTSKPVIMGELTASGATRTAGTQLAGRYEIVRLLGRGGMGEVYEAIDATDGSRVALKTVRADRLGDARVVERFRREIDLARRVVHANVARFIDAGVHESPTENEPALFFAMELLTGESLAELLRRRGALSTGEAGPLVAQMASALAAAHAVGVVHRDFKSGNVFLEPRPEGGVRVVVTDFGLARALDPDDRHDPALSRGIALLGTPAYMAPEQLEGAAVDARADLYALGVVLFEMVTGRLPFQGDTPIESAMLRFSMPPPSPRAVVVTLDERWNRTILRCLAREPRDRVASATDVIAMLEIAETPSTRRRHGSVRRWVGLAMAGAAAIAGGATLLARAHPTGASLSTTAPPPPASSTAAPPARARPALVVWPLRNASGDPTVAWLGASLGEMLRTELSSSEAVRVVPGASVARAVGDFGTAAASDLAPADVTRIGAALGASVLVDGVYVAIGGEGGRRVRLDLHVKDANSGESLASVAETGTEDQLFDVVERAADSLRLAMHAPPPEASSVTMARAAFPSDPVASREYAQGALLLQQLDFTGAREHIERAIALDPRAPLPHAALSEALLELGYVKQAGEEAKAALDRADGVARESRLAIEARYHERTYDWTGAADRWRVLSGFFPDNLEYGIALARAQLAAGLPARALETVAALRALPAPAGDDLRIDLVAGDAVANRSVDEEGKLAAAALAKAQALGSRAMQTEAEMLAARVKIGQGKADAALAEELRRIERTYRDAGNRGGEVRAATEVGHVYTRLDDWQSARRELERAETMAKELGYPALEARALRLEGDMLKTKGDLDAATLVNARGLAIARSIGDRVTESQLLHGQGFILKMQEKFAEARAKMEEAARVAADAGDRHDETNALDDMAEVLACLGDPRQALAVHERMAERYREEGSHADLEIALKDQIETLMVLGELDAASARLDEAERLGAGYERELRRLRLMRGEIAWMKGDYDTARALVRGAQEGEERAGGRSARDYAWELARIDVEAGTARTEDMLRWIKEDGEGSLELGLVAESLALEKKTRDALAYARRASKGAARCAEYPQRIEISLVAADALLRAGDDAGALAIARPLIADIEAHGLVRWSLEARAIVSLAGDPAKNVEEKRTERAALGAEATERGFLAIAARVREP